MAFTHERRRLTDLLKADARIIYTRHALVDRMPQRKITRQDVMKILRSGNVTNAELNKMTNDPTGQLTVSGRTISEGKMADIVVAINEEHITVIVVTVMDK